ncbi:MAG: hypothetical protein WC393_01585 [Candidatus Nanoarchaeia archaeon]|jgi:hypothetical protein
MEEELKQFFTPFELKVLELIEEAKKHKNETNNISKNTISDE